MSIEGEAGSQPRAWVTVGADPGVEGGVVALGWRGGDGAPPVVVATGALEIAAWGQGVSYPCVAAVAALVDSVARATATGVECGPVQWAALCRGVAVDREEGGTGDSDGVRGVDPVLALPRVRAVALESYGAAVRLRGSAASRLAQGAGVGWLCAVLEVGIGMSDAGGAREGVAAAQVVRVEPRTWQAEVVAWAAARGVTVALGGKGNAAKAAAVEAARALLPSLSLTPGRRRVGHAGIADAALLAIWAGVE